MASHTVSVSTHWESEINKMSVIFSPNNANLTPNDRLYFRWVAHTGGNQPSSVSVSGFSASAFTSNANITLTSPNSALQFRTVKNPAPNETDTLSVSTSSGGSKFFTAYVSTGIDNTPNAFSLGNNKTLANPNSTYSANAVKILGVTAGTPITISATNGAQTSLDGVNYSTANKVGYLNDIVYLRMDAYPYGQTRTTTLTMGQTSDTWSIVTRANPQNGQKIYFGHATGDISLSELGEFFGVLNVTYDINLSTYLKNNVFVPIISENANIPSSLPLNLTDFRNAATSFYFDSYPPNKFMVVNTLGVGSQSYYFGIDLGTEWSMGFGAGMNEASEFKMVFLERWLTGTNGIKTANSDVTLFDANSSNYSANNNVFALQVTTGQTVEKRYQGIVRLWAKNRYDPSVEIYADFEYEYFFYS